MATSHESLPSRLRDAGSLTRLPPVRLPSREELAAAARVAPLLRRHGLEPSGHRMSGRDDTGESWPDGAVTTTTPATPTVPAPVVESAPEQLSLL